MIKVTRINGTELIVNADMIEFVEATPDTLISLVSGRKILVREKVAEVVEKVVGYRRLVGHSFPPRSEAAEFVCPDELDDNQ